MISLEVGTPRRRHIALMIFSANEWSRQVHAGIAAFAREQGNWDCWLQPSGMTNAAEFVQQFNGDGIIGRFSEPLTASLREKRCPSINISWHGTHQPKVPLVACDLSRCSRLAAEYYRKQGFRNLAYVGPHAISTPSDPAWEAIRDVAAESGMPLYSNSQSVMPITASRKITADDLENWLQTLPRPVGIICSSTHQARDVILAATTAGIHVPEELSVLAIDHDPLLASLSPMSITHIEQDAQRIGYEAARQLADLMEGRDSPPEPTWLPPVGLVEGASTKRCHLPDELVHKAIIYIRDNISRPLQVADLTNAFQVSRRCLEDRFRKSVNHSPAEEIRLFRVHELKRLLEQTEHPLAEIASLCGFVYPEVMIRFFKKATGETPGNYRKSLRETTCS